MKIRPLQGGGVHWWCPACRCSHGGRGWNEISPGTVVPSAVVVNNGRRCHSSVTNYKIVFAADCTTGWAGREVDLEETS